jgi:hypothetical protein
MNKLKLDLEDLTVTSMETQEIPDTSGTVYANSDHCTLSCSCPPRICDPLVTRIDC